MFLERRKRQSWNVSLKSEVHLGKTVQIILEKLSLMYWSEVSNIPEVWRDGEKIVNMELRSLGSSLLSTIDFFSGYLIKLFTFCWVQSPYLWYKNKIVYFTVLCLWTANEGGSIKDLSKELSFQHEYNFYRMFLYSLQMITANSLKEVKCGLKSISIHLNKWWLNQLCSESSLN